MIDNVIPPKNLWAAFFTKAAPRLATLTGYPANRSLSRDRACQLSLLFFIMLTAPIAFAQKTSTTYDKTFDFSGHKRYAWRENHLMTHQHPDTNEMMDLKIVKAVNQTLIARGFVEVKDRPDFYINYDGAQTCGSVLEVRHRRTQLPLVLLIAPLRTGWETVQRWLRQPG